MKIPTTLDRKNMKKGLKSPALAIVLVLLLVLSSLPVYAGEQRTDQTETPTVTEATGSESAQKSEASGEQNQPLADELEPVQPIDTEEAALTANTDWTTTKPHEGEVLHGGYVGFKNKASGKYLTIPGGSTALGTNVCQQGASTVANAQEFYLSYTYNTNKNVAYFTIFPVNPSTGNATTTRVKSAAISSGLANVSLQFFMPTESTDRWQIEHVEDNYYCIYLASNPGTTGTKYALTANSGNGTASGTSTTATGNVYVSAYTGADNQLWQICADGKPMGINGIDISVGVPIETYHEDTLSFYYVPKSFNATLVWNISPSDGGIIHDNTDVTFTCLGGINIALNLSLPNSAMPIVLSTWVYSIPRSDKYYIANVDTGKYVDIEGPNVQTGTVIQQWSFHTGNQEKWQIVDDGNTIGYVRLRSRYSSKYLAVDPTDASTVIQTTVQDEYSLWRIETTINGNVSITCKALESSSQVLAVPLTSNANGTNLTTFTYTDDTNYQDEWTLYCIGPYTVNITVRYDYSYNNRYENAGTRISNQILALQEKYLTEFGITINATAPVVFSSYVDANCSSNPTQACIHATDNECSNSKTYTSGDVLLSNLHHTNVSNVLLRVPVSDVTESLTIAYLGHDKCSISTIKNNDGTTTMAHKNSAALGSTYVRLGLCGVMNFETIPSETKTLIHEFGHLYGIIDHYGGSGKSTDQMNEECQSDIYSEYCIYGENRYDETVLSEFTICDGCRLYVINNANQYDH